MAKKRSKSGARPQRVARIKARSVAPADGEAHVDGCDVEFDERDATPDADLPPAIGGVEILRAARRRPRRA